MKNLGKSVVKSLKKTLSEQGFVLKGSVIEVTDDNENLCFTVRGVAQAKKRKK